MCCISKYISVFWFVTPCNTALNGVVCVCVVCVRVWCVCVCACVWCVRMCVVCANVCGVCVSVCALTRACVLWLPNVTKVIRMTDCCQFFFALEDQSLNWRRVSRCFFCYIEYCSLPWYQTDSHHQYKRQSINQTLMPNFLITLLLTILGGFTF